MYNFFQTEALGTTINVKSGSCKCRKCPVPGSRYSHREEAELKLIQDGLRYGDINVLDYVLPIYQAKGAVERRPSYNFKTMIATEKSLAKDPYWVDEYDAQVVDMVFRGAIREVSDK